MPAGTLYFGETTLVMGVLNATPDSFSDGGLYASPELATERAAKMVAEGAQIIDIGGESTRPGAASVSIQEELRRVIPVVEALKRANPEVVLSVDTTKSVVARAAIDAGAEMINDVSGLRFDPRLGEEVARAGVGLVLMHSRGSVLQQMHGLEPVIDIKSEVSAALRRSVTAAERSGVSAPPSRLIRDLDLAKVRNRTCGCSPT
ncbi:MAG: dihydropteroate synthase [Pyrinomonadaceae bacterium]